MSHSVLVIGDCHFMDKNLPDCKNLMDKVYSLVNTNKYDFIVVLGDLIHTHEVFKMFPYNLAITFLKTLSKMLPTYFITGNHERSANTVYLTDDHPYIALEDYPNLTIIYKAKYIQIKNQSYFCVPYVAPGRFYEALLTTSKDETELLERFKTTTAI